MSKGIVAMSLHGLVWAGIVAYALWAVGVSAGAARYDTATPHSSPNFKYKYIPINSNYNHEAVTPSTSLDEPDSGGSQMPASEVILTALRTALDVVKRINKNRRTKPGTPARNTTLLHIRRTKTENGTEVAGRGFEDYYDEHHDHDTTTTAKPVKQGRYTDPWAGYYDWIINEGSFKFWSAFQLFTAALLLYACFSAIYYAKFNPIIPDYSLEYDDYFFQRSAGRNARSLDSSVLPSGIGWINPTVFQFILDAISKHYEEE